MSIPDENADWRDIFKFSTSFNAYEYWGSFDKTAEIANKHIKEYTDEGSLSEDPIIIKTCLFFEQRRNHHQGTSPSKEGRKYIRSLIKKLRIIEGD